MYPERRQGLRTGNLTTLRELDGQISNYLQSEIPGENCALMIKGHGAIVTGETIEDACVNMVQLERTAKMILVASGPGKVSALPKSLLHSIF